jgi:hypothetical protein
MKQDFFPRTLTLFLIISWALPGSASEVGEKMSLSGFGSWAAAQTDGNEYLGGEEDTAYNTAEFTLGINAAPVDRLAIGAQISLELEEGELETELEMAFADWTFSDRLHLRAGISRLPFGLYADTLEIGTSRPFYDLPPSVYGNSEITGESYLGLGLHGVIPIGSAELDYDVYGGEIEVDSFEGLIAQALEIDEDQEVLTDLIGFDLQIRTSASWIFGLSAYQGVAAEDEDAGGGSDTHRAFSLSARWENERWKVRAELVSVDAEGADLEGDAAYFEVGRFLNDTWQLGARYDWSERESADGSVEALLPASAFEHQEIALTLNYWFSNYFVMKLSVHQVEGLLFATVDEDELHDPSNLDDETQLIKLGAQFTF